MPVAVGQVGLGYWGKNLLRNFSALPNTCLLQACDQCEKAIAELKPSYPKVSFTTSYQDLLANNNLEAVVIATETPKHYAMAAAALKAGKHVFVEKPMAQTTAQAHELVELSEQQNRVLMVGHLLLYHPAFQYVDQCIQANKLGEVFYLYSTRVNLGIVRQQENALQSLAPHDLSVALQFLKPQPVAVAAHGQSYLQKGVEDVTFTTVYFNDGRMAHLHTSWLDPHKIRKVTVVGSEKMAVIDDMKTTEKVRIYDKGINPPPGEAIDYETFAEAMSVRMGDVHIPRIQMQEPLRRECEHFITCVQTNSQPHTDGQNGLTVVRLLEAATRSLKQQGTVVEV